MAGQLVLTTAGAGARHADRTGQGRRALEEFYARETHLLEKDLGERTLTHRLAVHLERQLPAGRSIAITTGSASGRCGCRRDRSSRPTIDLGKSVYPDIVVHQRAIPEQPARDRSAQGQPTISRRNTTSTSCARLTDPHLWFAYRIGVYLMLGKNGVTVSEVYVGGVIDQALSAWLAERLKEAGLMVEPSRHDAPRVTLCRAWSDSFSLKFALSE